MRIYNYTPGEKIAEEGTVVALGFFDGVHAAHRHLLSEARSIARARGLAFAVFTFVAEDSDIKRGGRIYSTDEKLELLRACGTDAVILADFSSVSKIEAEDFVLGSLLTDMKCRVAVAGYDFRFGKDRRGDIRLLTTLFSEAGADCVIEAERKIDGERISATKIKELLECGNIERANLFLGSPYFISASVKHGKGLGKKLGFPTVNCDLTERTSLLKSGVYRTAAEISGRLYTSVTNVGVCPTFDSCEALHAETYIVDYSGDLYGERVRIFFLGYLREEKRFDSPNDLIMQINVDKNMAMSQNGDLKWLEIGLN